MACRGQRTLARRIEFLRRIGARGFQQPVAERITVGFRKHERLIDQRCEHVEHVDFVKVLAAADGDRALKRKTVDEDTETAKEHTLVAHRAGRGSSR